MARQTFEAWIPEEYGSDTLAQLAAQSAMEGIAGPGAITMTTDTRHVPRSGAVSVGVIPKGSAYPEDAGVNDEVLLYVTKFGTAIRIAEEDIADAPENLFAQKSAGWARSWAVEIDNACFAVTAGPGVVNTTVPFTSIYYAVRHNDTSTGIGAYTADANYLSLSNATLTGTASGQKSGYYTAASNLLGLLETGDYFDEANMWLVGHPAFKKLARNVKDDQGRPIWIQGTGGTPDTLFGYRIRWSLGARTSATAVYNPSGNPLLIFGNTDYLRYGKRSGPEYMLIGGDTGVGALTDEAIMKARARRAFVPGNVNAFAVLELVP